MERGGSLPSLVGSRHDCDLALIRVKLAELLFPFLSAFPEQPAWLCRQYHFVYRVDVLQFPRRLDFGREMPDSSNSTIAFSIQNVFSFQNIFSATPPAD